MTAVVWLWHRMRRKEPALAPRWLVLWLLSWLAALSHIFLDWTNNYGVRPFFPFNPRWYEGSIAFILEPVVFGALLLGLVIPGILGLADREIGASGNCLPRPRLGYCCVGFDRDRFRSAGRGASPRAAPD